MKEILRLAFFTLIFTILMPVMLLAQIKSDADIIPRMVLSPSQTSPKMNGHLDAANYSHIGSGFIGFNTRRLMSGEGLYGMTATKEALYLAIRVPASAMMSVRTGRDTELYFETSTEFFILDEKDPSQGFHFVTNPIGGIYDATTAHEREETQWTCEGLKVINNFDNRFWVCELRIPWKSLEGIDPAKGFRLGMFFSETTAGSEGSRGITTPEKGRGYLAPNNFIRVTVQEAVPAISVLLESDKLVGDLTLSIPIEVKASNEAAKSKIRVWASLLPEDKNLDDIVRNAYEQKLFLAELPTGAQPVTRTIHVAKMPEAGSVYLQIARGSDILYQKVIPYAKEKTDLSILYLYTSVDKKKVSVTVRQPKLTADEAGDVSIVDAQGQVLVRKGLARDSQPQTVDLPLAKVPPGACSIVAEIYKKADRASVLKTQEAYEKFDHPSWLNNTLGLTKGKAPAPWTPIAIADERTVKVWGRNYQLAPTGFADQILTQNHPMLVRPMSLVVQDAAGKAQTLTSSKFAWKSRADDVVVFESILKSKEVSVWITGRVEFDGFVWYDLKFTPARGKNLPTMTLEIPCDPARISLVNANDIYSKNSGKIPEKGWSKNLLGSPIFWFGDEDGGIQWFADDLRGWQLADYTHSAQIVTENGARVVRIHLFDSSATRKDQSQKLAFGFQATPVRPMPKDWRNYRVNSGVETNLWIYYQPNTTYTGNMIPAPETRAKLEDARKRGFKWLPYFTFLNISPYEKEILYYGEEWRSPILARQQLTNKNWGTYDYMCPNSPSYRDYFVAKTAEYVDTVQPGSLYYDFVQPIIYQCMNADHGCMWKDNLGNARGSMRLLGCREMAKRLYVMLKEKDPEAIMVQHNSGGVVMPINAFSEMTVTGEEFTQDVFRDGNYYRIYPLDIFRMECIPQPWGMVTCVMPEFVRAVETWDTAREKGWVKQPENLKALWHLMGLAIVHDSALQGDNRIVQVMDIVTLVKKRLGWSDTTQFYPYWKPEKSIFVKQTPADENTIVSGYLAEKGILLVPMNNTDQDTEMTIQIKPNRFGRDFVFTDERTKETFKTENGLLKILVSARQPRLLVWEKK